MEMGRETLEMRVAILGEIGRARRKGTIGGRTKSNFS